MSPETLRSLPGIGHYTAAAVLAFAANRDVIAIDTNVRRVHHRVFGRTDEPFLASLVPAGKGREWNNALMDFGATQCTKQPECSACPLRTQCRAYREQDFTFVVPKQSRFAGSVRFYRGRILDELRAGPRSRAALLALGGHTEIALARLESEGLVRRNGATYRL